MLVKTECAAAPRKWAAVTACNFLCYSLLAFLPVLSRTLLLAAQVPATAAVQFTNATSHAGIKFVHYPGNKGIAIIREVFGPGVCVADFDGDGWQDIYFVNGRDLYNRGVAAQNALYQNNRDGIFTDV